MKKYVLSICIILLGATGCMNKEKVIGRQMPKIENNRFNAEALWAMGRMGAVNVNRNTGAVAYTVSYYSVEQNKSNTEIFVIADPNKPKSKQLTKSNLHETDPQWLGNDMLFLSSKSGKNQIWTMQSNGKHKKQVTDYDGDIEGFRLSPDGSKILFVAQVKTVATTADKYPDLPKASGRIVTDLMYKHWDEWLTFYDMDKEREFFWA